MANNFINSWKWVILFFGLLFFINYFRPSSVSERKKVQFINDINYRGKVIGKGAESLSNYLIIEDGTLKKIIHLPIDKEFGSMFNGFKNGDFIEKKKGCRNFFINGKPSGLCYPLDLMYYLKDKRDYLTPPLE